MLRTLIVLRDGTELFSGRETENAIISSTITECVNGAQELTLGSVCSNMFEAQLLTPDGTLLINAGDEITVYKVDDHGGQHKVGLFTLEKPTRSSANKLSVTAYDRISWLDKDLTQWLASLSLWPYSLYEFAEMVCNACKRSDNDGFELLNENLPNGDYKIQKFSANGITGRQLMQWIGEIAGRFCRATADGKVEFAWYTPVDVSIAATGIPAVRVTDNKETGDLSLESARITVIEDGSDLKIQSDILDVVDDGEGNITLRILDAYSQLYYFQNGLSYEDYTVSQIKKVQIRQNEEDVGTIYSNDDEDDVNTYIITGNYLLTASSAGELQPIAKALYEQLLEIEYTPCKVSIPANLDIHAGDIVKITDRNGKEISAYIMTKTQSGQKDTLECTGSVKRDSTTVVNNRTYEALAGKVLNLKMDVDGLHVENRKGEEALAKLDLQLGGISAEVARQAVQNGSIQSQLTQLSQTATEISLSVKQMQDNGTTKLENEFGMSIDGSAVTIHRAGSEMENKLDETGMFVNRGTTPMLRADANGVLATDVTVRNFLVIGDHARFEDYGTDRTACYWT